jgi:hypothetical protein
MNKSTVDFPPDYAKIESQIKGVMDESLNTPQLAMGRAQFQRKPLDSYESKMRSFAALCVTGR